MTVRIVSNAALAALAVLISKTGTPWPKRAPYNGPCKSGWIHSKFVEIIAG